MCWCGLPADFAQCCGPRHDGSRPAETAEALMRSRYSAFAVGNAKYLAATQRKATTVESEAELAAWAKSVAWVGLTVHSAAANEVEFTARYLEAGALISLHEKSGFEQVNGRWLYTEGEPTVSRQVLERNDKCPCGSGKKFKACHA